MELWDILAYMLGQAPLVAVAVAVLYVLLNREIHRLRQEVDGRFTGLKKRVAGLEKRVEEIDARLRELVGEFRLVV